MPCLPLLGDCSPVFTPGRLRAVLRLGTAGGSERTPRSPDAAASSGNGSHHETGTSTCANTERYRYVHTEAGHHSSNAYPDNQRTGQNRSKEFWIVERTSPKIWR